MKIRWRVRSRLEIGSSRTKITVVQSINISRSHTGIVYSREGWINVSLLLKNGKDESK